MTFRRAKPPTTIAGLTIDTRCATLSVGSRTQRLPPQEAKLAAALAIGVTQPDELQAEVFGAGKPKWADVLLRVLVSRLRNRLDAIGAGVVIEARYRDGYRMQVLP